MRLTRRQFNQIAMAFGLSASAPGAFGGCGEDELSGSTPPTATETERKSLHFDLSRSAAAAEHTLHAGGKRYLLRRHTAESRARARAEKPALAGIADQFLTHYAEDVELSLVRVHRIHVTVVDRMRGHGLALVAMYIPTAALERARRARNLTIRQSGSDCGLSDEVADDFVDTRTAAKAIILHHPDLVNSDPETAAAVNMHMDHDQAAAVDNFADLICEQGWAWEHEEGYEDGWCVLVPLLDADGNKLLDANSQVIYDYQYSQVTSDNLGTPIAAVLESVKNDPTLQGKQYQVIYHGDPVDEDALPDATPTILSSIDTAAVAQQAPGDSDAQMTLKTTGYHHNVLFYDAKNSAVDRTVSLRILNLNFLWYGLYLEYLDGDGVALATENRSSYLAELFANDLDLETDTLKFWDVISSPPTLFGVPVPFPYQITITLPEGASQVRLNLIGPGAHGRIDYGPTVVVGTVMTGIMCFAIPSYFLAKMVGQSETLTFLQLFDQKSLMLKTLLLYSQIYSAIRQSGTNDLGVEGSITSIVTGLTQDLFINMKTTMPELWAWLTEEVAEDEAEQSTPFVGWIIRILAITGTLADIATSLAEITTNPININNTVSFTNSVTVVISHDQGDFEFPRDAVKVEVQITAGAKALPAKVVALSHEDLSQDTITVVVENVPSTGADATVSVNFLAANNYVLATSAVTDGTNLVAGDVTFTNKLPASGPLTVAVPIVENPIPITAQTQYTHHHKLEYANGKYQWNYTSTPPALDPAVCGSSQGLCDLGQITVWVPGGMIGYSWLGNSSSIRDCSTGAAGQLNTFQNLSLKADPNAGLQSPGCGFAATVPIAYDARVPVGQNGYHFYLDPLKISDSDPEWHLRRLTFGSALQAPNRNESWGRFRIGIDRIAVYNKGSTPMIVGISRRHHKLSVLEIPSTPYTNDDFANNAKVMSAKGEGNDSLLLDPIALTLADNGAILILQGSRRSIKAFDFDGKPWKFFSNGTASVLPMIDEGEVTYLDISVDPTNTLFVLSHTGSGTQRSDYRLDVYDANTGQHIVRNTGIAVGRMVVDKFRGLYSLNYERVVGSPKVEPSISVWSPSPPSA